MIMQFKGNSGIKRNLFRIIVLYLNFQFLINFLTILLQLSKSFYLKAGRKAVEVFRHLGKNTSRVTMVSSAV